MEFKHLPEFYVRQKITLMVNRYEILDQDGGSGGLLAFAQQKRFKFKEHVAFYADESKSDEVFSFTARQGLDVRAEHDVFATDGQAIGYFKKEFGASLLRSTWTLKYGDVTAVGQERNQFIAILRRIIKISDVWIPFAFHFDFVDQATGQIVMTSERTFSVRDRYTVKVQDPRLDFRVAASMAVALDALQSR
jgi:uncharacterized protein YxjI